MVEIDIYMSYIDRMATLEYISNTSVQIPPGLLSYNAGKYFCYPIIDTVHLNEIPDLNVSIQEHTHNVYHIVIYTKGNNTFVYEGEHVPVKPGSLVFINPKAKHSFLRSRSEPCEYHELTFSLNPSPSRYPDIAKLLSYFTGIPVKKLPLLLQIEDYHLQKLSDLYLKILEKLRYSNGLLAQAKASSSMFDLFVYICSEIFGKADSSEENQTLSRLTEARDYIQKNYPNRIYLEQLADMIHLSREHFCRLFKKQFNRSPIDYQMDLRINAAATLLRTTDMQCQTIAHRLGFSDVFSFSKAFQTTQNYKPDKISCTTIIQFPITIKFLNHCFLMPAKHYQPIDHNKTTPDSPPPYFRANITYQNINNNSRVCSTNPPNAKKPSHANTRVGLPLKSRPSK